jgi:hypothetical protein
MRALGVTSPISPMWSRRRSVRTFSDRAYWFKLVLPCLSGVEPVAEVRLGAYRDLTVGFCTVPITSSNS